MMTGDLFSDPPKKRRKPTGKELRDKGMEEAADHAEGVVPGWNERAFRWFIAYALILGTGAEFLTEAARQYAEGRGLEKPPDKRAWGQVPRRAARAGVVKKAGYAPATDPKVHCSANTLWRVL